MENNFQYGDIIFLALVAAFIALRLRSILGRNTGFGSADAPKPLVHAQVEDIVQRVEKTLPHAPEEEDALLAALPEEEAKKNITAIRAVDAEFSLQDFLHGARAAFDMVLGAFTEGDKDTLKTLLAPAVFDAFSAEMENRANAEQKHESTLVSIKSADITEVRLKDRHIALITVKFISEQIHVTRGAGGAIIAGNPSHTVQVEDHWTFERDLRSRNPNWTIIDT